MENSRTKKMSNKDKNSSFERDVYEKFCELRKNNKIVSNEILTQIALDFKQKHGMIGFKASSSWLIRFKNKFKIRYSTISGEEMLVDNTILEKKKEEFFKIIEKYDPAEIFNLDETALMYKRYPKKNISFE